MNDAETETGMRVPRQDSPNSNLQFSKSGPASPRTWREGGRDARIRSGAFHKVKLRTSRAARVPGRNRQITTIRFDDNVEFKFVVLKFMLSYSSSIAPFRWLNLPFLFEEKQIYDDSCGNFAA